MHAPLAATPLVSLEALRKSVPGGRMLFDGLSLQLTPGAFIAIMGESGAGKSTLLNLIAGLDRAESGRIIIDGKDMGALDEEARTRLRRDAIGFVFQAFHVLPYLTLAQNVALPLALQHAPAEAATERARAMLDQVGLGGRDADFPRQLSGGEVQRVAIARALIHRPRLILADEPTGNLDPETASRVLALFARQVRDSGAAAILVTHSQTAAASADRVFRLTPHGLADPHAG